MFGLACEVNIYVCEDATFVFVKCNPPFDKKVEDSFPP